MVEARAVWVRAFEGRGMGWMGWRLRPGTGGWASCMWVGWGAQTVQCRYVCFRGGGKGICCMLLPGRKWVLDGSCGDRDGL